MKLPRPALLAIGWFACFFAPHVGAADAKPKATDETYELPKMEVKSHAVCSFGIGVVATWDRATQTIAHLFVDTVTPGSAAEAFGLQQGDEIISLNGLKVSTLKGGMKQGSDLFNLLVDQPVGREIKIEVAVRVVKRISLNALPYRP